jgi:hypothetical protein
MDPKQEALIEAQTRLANRQNWWEGIKATAMVLLAAAAISAAGRLSDWIHPAAPQVITVHIDGPLKLSQ